MKINFLSSLINFYKYVSNTDSQVYLRPLKDEVDIDIRTKIISNIIKTGEVSRQKVELLSEEHFHKLANHFDYHTIYTISHYKKIQYGDLLIKEQKAIEIAKEYETEVINILTRVSSEKRLLLEELNSVNLLSSELISIPNSIKDIFSNYSNKNINTSSININKLDFSDYSSPVRSEINILENASDTSYSDCFSFREFVPVISRTVDNIANILCILF